MLLILNSYYYLQIKITEATKALRKLINTRLKKNVAKHDLLLLFLNPDTSQIICNKVDEIHKFITERRRRHTYLISQTKMSYENIIKTLKKKIVQRYPCINYIGKHLIKEMLHYNNTKSLSNSVVYIIEKLLNFTKLCIDLLDRPVVLRISEWMNICIAIRNLVMGLLGYNVQQFSPYVISILIHQPLLHASIKEIISGPTSEQIPSILSALNSLQSNNCLKIKKNWIIDTTTYDITLKMKESIQYFLNNFILWE